MWTLSYEGLPTDREVELSHQVFTGLVSVQLVAQLYHYDAEGDT